MDQTNTQIQGGGGLQTGGRPTQETAGNFQAGSGVGLSTDNTSSVLNQTASMDRLSVSVDGSGSKVSTGPPAPIALDNAGLSGTYIIVPLLFLVAFAVLLAYLKTRRLGPAVADLNSAEMELPESTGRTIKTKKKRKKPKRPHHH